MNGCADYVEFISQNSAAGVMRKLIQNSMTEDHLNSRPDMNSESVLTLGWIGINYQNSSLGKLMLIILKTKIIKFKKSGNKI